MAFGTLKGTLTGNGASVTNPSDASGSVVIAVGDLVVAVMSQQDNLTVSGVTDNLGNSYTAQNAGTDAGFVTGRMFYSVVTVGGTLTVCHFAATASSSNYSVGACVYTGTFATPAIDANPANVSNDTSDPFTCPATGTLAQTSELIIGWVAYADSGTADLTASSPGTVNINPVDPAGFAEAGIQSWVVSATTTVTPAFSSSVGMSTNVLGTASFMQATAGSSAPPAFTNLGVQFVLTGTLTVSVV